MRESWERRIERAKRLAEIDEAARPLLTFYSGLLGSQRDIATLVAAVGTLRLTGSLAHDLSALRPALPAFLAAIERSAPEPLAREARTLLSGPDSACDDLLTAAWARPSDRQFFAKAVLQPYA